MRVGLGAGKETAVARHARALGCQREWPFVGFCVGCPFESTCTVPRAPITLWIVRIDQTGGQAEANVYLNSLTTSDLGSVPRNLAMAGITSYRTTAIQMRCGDLLMNSSPEEKEYTLTPTQNLHERFQPGMLACSKNIVMSSQQVRFNQIVYYGRRAVLSVQVCGRDCAMKLADSLNGNWKATMDLIREVRPLRTFK